MHKIVKELINKKFDWNNYFTRITTLKFHQKSITSSLMLIPESQILITTLTEMLKFKIN